MRIRFENIRYVCYGCLLDSLFLLRLDTPIGNTGSQVRTRNLRLYSRRVDSRLAPAADRHLLDGVLERRPSYWFLVAPCELDDVPLFFILRIPIAHLVTTDHFARMCFLRFG